jgi:hypothetical protein
MDPPPPLEKHLTRLSVDEAGTISAQDSSSTLSEKSIKDPTTFLSLPREIRQKILAHSHVTIFAYYLRMPELLVTGDYCTIASRLVMRRIMAANDLERGANWSSSLMRVNSYVREDMGYVHAKWVKDLSTKIVEWKEAEQDFRGRSGLIESMQVRRGLPAILPQ